MTDDEFIIKPRGLKTKKQSSSAPVLSVKIIIDQFSRHRADKTSPAFSDYILWKISDPRFENWGFGIGWGWGGSCYLNVLSCNICISRARGGGGEIGNPKDWRVIGKKELL